VTVPSFLNADLSEDPSVKGLVDSAERRTKASFHDHDNRTKEKIEEVRAEAKKEKEEIEKENKKAANSGREIKG